MDGQRPSLDELMASMPQHWRHRWCESELCGCLGCANGSGKLSFYGYSREDHREWLASNPQETQLWAPEVQFSPATPLSPVEVLQERYRSAADEYPDPDCLAAALEAMADQVTPLLGRSPEDSREDERLCVRDELLAIAAELRGGADG